MTYNKAVLIKIDDFSKFKISTEIHKEFKNFEKTQNDFYGNLMKYRTFSDIEDLEKVEKDRKEVIKNEKNKEEYLKEIQIFQIMLDIKEKYNCEVVTKVSGLPFTTVGMTKVEDFSNQIENVINMYYDTSNFYSSMKGYYSQFEKEFNTSSPTFDEDLKEHLKTLESKSSTNSKIIDVKEYIEHFPFFKKEARTSSYVLSQDLKPVDLDEYIENLANQEKTDGVSDRTNKF